MIVIVCPLGKAVQWVGDAKTTRHQPDYVSTPSVDDDGCLRLAHESTTVAYLFWPSTSAFLVWSGVVSTTRRVHEPQQRETLLRAMTSSRDTNEQRNGNGQT